MARDEGEQQAMTSERLAEIESRVIEASYPRYDYPYSTDAKRDMSDLLAEVERLRAREAALLAALRDVADTGADFDMNTGNSWLLFPGLYAAEQCREQARALLASADSERSGGDGG